jgi:hypothetical protein
MVRAVVLVQAVVPTAVRVADRALARVAAQVRAEDPVAALPVEVVAQVEPRAADLAVARPADPVLAQVAVQAQPVIPAAVQSDLVVVLAQVAGLAEGLVAAQVRAVDPVAALPVEVLAQVEPRGADLAVARAADPVLARVAGLAVDLGVVRGVGQAAVQSLDTAAVLPTVMVQLEPREADLVVVPTAGPAAARVAVQVWRAEPAVAQSLDPVQALSALRITHLTALARLPTVAQ